jgi:asparagine synthase (glutamine-hydrolysing)
LSAIYGLVRFEGGVATHELHAMREAIAYWGPDGGSTSDTHAAVGCLVSHDERARFAVMQLANGDVVVATARLDNRDELTPLFGDGNDRALVAAAYAKWGEDACTRLYGDWSFAAWSPRARRLLLARDHFGNTALYHHRAGDAFAFASSRKALFALPHVPRRLNELRLAQHLAFWVTDGAATLHEDVFRLPPGHHLAVTSDAARLTRFWHPEDLPELRLPNDAAYVDAFLARYDAAVRARVRTTRRIATTLSSGLDSGSVTALAARAVAPSRLTAFTSVPRFAEIAQLLPRVVVDEWPLAHVVAEGCGIDDHRPVSAEGVTTIGAFRRSLLLHDEPEFAAGNLHWIIDLLAESQAANAGVLLTGQLGNGGVSWSGDQQRALRSFLRGRWVDAWRAIREFQRNRRTSFARAVSAQIARPLQYRGHAFAFRRGWSDGVLARHDAMHPAFARRMRIGDRMREAGYDPLATGVLEVRAQRLRVLLPEINPIGAIWHESGAGYGLDVVDPTGDVRLLELCLAIPDEQFVRGDRDRWLMRRAMDGILPPEVQWNTRRGSQGADLALRLRADSPEIDLVMRELASSPPVREYLDPPAMERRWVLIRDGAPAAAFAAAPIFARTLLFALFLADSA